MKRVVFILCAVLIHTAVCAQTLEEIQKVVASDSAKFSFFGSSVSISGNYAIVGAYGDDDKGYYTGAAYIFYYDGNNWKEQVKVRGLDVDAYDYFGISVSINGDYAIIGARGKNAAYIFHNNGSSWEQQAKLTPSNSYRFKKFGQSVDIHGNYAIVGDPEGNLAYVFIREGSNWVEEAKLMASEIPYYSNSDFGSSVAIHENYAVVGAPRYSNIEHQSGTAYIFKHDTDSGGWSEQVNISLTDEAELDLLGYAVDISNTLVVVGAPSGTTGAAYIYARDSISGDWFEEVKLTPRVERIGFGVSVSISDSYVIVGNCWGGYYSTGSAHIFQRDSSGWNEQVKLIGSDVEDDYFGISVGISDYVAFVGADRVGIAHGSAYFFEFDTPSSFNNCELLNLGPDTLLCQTDSLVLDAKIENAQYLWNNGNTSRQTVIRESGMYWVTATKEDCTVTDTIAVDFLQLDLGADTTFCETINHTLKVDDDRANVLWSTGETNSEINVTAPGIYWVEVSKGNCTLADSIQIDVLRQPEVEAIVDTVICKGEQMVWNIHLPDYTYFWEDGSTSSSKILSKAGEYRVYIENECFALEQTLVVEEEDCDCDIFVPNVFTPNGDEKNDLFQPVLHQKIQNPVLRVYNRWGRLLYENINFPSWNGVLQDKEAPAGNYYWTLEYECLLNDIPELRQKKGWLTLLRK